MKLLILLFISFILIGCNQIRDKQNKTKQETTTELSKQQEKVEQSAIITEAKIIKIRCSTSIVLDTEEDIDTISDNLIYSFLYTFDEGCKNNVEYCEFSNEVYLS